MSGGGYSQDDQGFFQPPPAAGYYENQSAGYDMGVDQQEQYPQEPQFGQFDYSQAPGGGYGNEPFTNPQPAQSPYVGSIMTPDPSTAFSPETENFDDEPPLLEELGINFEHIWHKTLAVLNPLKEADATVMQDTDLAGPLVFCLAFGGALLLSGKIHFGYIYGIGVVGCLAMYALLNLMSMTGVAATCTISVLGYCILPMVLLSFFSILVSLQGIVGMIVTALIVLWCSISASKLFVSALAMDQQQLLVAYPCTLVYGVFALLTVF